MDFQTIPSSNIRLEVSPAHIRKQHWPELLHITLEIIYSRLAIRLGIQACSRRLYCQSWVHFTQWRIQRRDGGGRISTYQIYSCGQEYSHWVCKNIEAAYSRPSSWQVLMQSLEVAATQDMRWALCNDGVFSRLEVVPVNFGQYGLGSQFSPTHSAVMLVVLAGYVLKGGVWCLELASIRLCVQTMTLMHTCDETFDEFYSFCVRLSQDYAGRLHDYAWPWYMALRIMAEYSELSWYRKTACMHAFSDCLHTLLLVFESEEVDGKYWMETATENKVQWIRLHQTGHLDTTYY